MGATGASIKAALQSCGAYGGQKWSMDELANGANDAARTLGITTKEGLAVLISQCMIESAWFRSTVEYTSQYTARYDPYRGRTFVMLTWVANYRLAGRYAKKKGLLSDSEYFVKNPARLGDYKWAWHGPAAYFEANGLVDRANRGENKAVGRIIHAGPGRVNYPTNQLERNRENHATKAYNAVLRSGITAPTGAPSTGAVVLPGVKYSVKQIQELVGVTVDGIAGPATVAAIKEIQSTLGLTPDGVVGKSTEAAMASIIEKLDALAADVKQIKSDTRHMPKRVWAHRIDTPGSIKKEFTSVNGAYSAGGLMAYNLIDFYLKGRNDKILEALAELDKDES